MRLTRVRFTVRTLMFAVAVVAVAPETWAAGPPRIPDELIEGRFPVARGGKGSLIVPVHLVGGRECRFVVDTGTNRTTIDTSLLFVPPQRLSRMITPRGALEVKLYEPPVGSLGRPPVGSLGRLPFCLPGLVVGMDMRTLTKSTEQPSDGLLGMDYLAHHVIHIDFDHGELLFLKSAPKLGGVEIPLVSALGGLPTVEAEVMPGEKVRFVVDTGWEFSTCGSLEVRQMQSLIDKGGYREVGSSRIKIATGTHQVRRCRGKRLEVAGFHVEGPVFSEELDTNRLGLGFWSRFAVTFDFPGRKAYLFRSDNE